MIAISLLGTPCLVRSLCYLIPKLVMLLTSFRIPENQIFQRPTTTVPHVCWSSWIELMRREMQATRQELMNAVLNTVRVASPKQRQEMKEALLRQQAHQKALVQPQSPFPKK